MAIGAPALQCDQRRGGGSAALQTALTLVRLIEEPAKPETERLKGFRTEEERKRDMIKSYERTGNKPEGWTRDCDYAYKKKKEEDAAYENRKREAFKSHNTKNKDDEEYEMLSSVLQSATENMIKNEKARATWKDKIRVSDGGRQDPFIDAIIDYLDTLSDDNRRIEACTNIIKVCKNISVELQRKAI